MPTLAVDIGGTKFSMAVFEDGRMVRRETRATDQAGGKDWMLGQVTALARAWQGEFRLERCGVGFGGPVDFARQRVACSVHVGGWSDFPLAAGLQDALGIPAVVDNDANVGALGEGLCGAGRGSDPLLYITLSTGIGGGLLAGGRVLRGADSCAGEVGHLTVRPDGPECLCGRRGCLERMCSGLWLERDHGRPAKELLRDEAFVRAYVANLALGLKACLMLFNPARVVIGGGLSKAGEALFGPLREELRRQLSPRFPIRMDVVPAALGDDSVLFGADALARGLEKK